MHYQAFYEQTLREASSRNELYELFLMLYMLYVIMLCVICVICELHIVSTNELYLVISRNIEGLATP